MNDTEEQKNAGKLRVEAKIGILAALIVLVGVAIYARNNKPAAKTEKPQTTVTASAPPAAPPAEPTKTALPKLVDLGADKCIPCRMMAPILDQLKTEYAGKLDVVFIDVWKNTDAGKHYGIGLIPTQIFFDAAGKELFRHEGFFAKEDILAKWQELGVTLNNEATSSSSPSR